MKVFVVTLDWACEDNKGHDTFIYKKHSDAYDKFKQLILDEREPSTSWVGDVEFDDDGEPVEDRYEFECDDNASGESEVYWRIEDLWVENKYTSIELQIMEVL